MSMIDEVREHLKKHSPHGYRAETLAKVMGEENVEAVRDACVELKALGEVVTCLISGPGYTDEDQYRICAGRGVMINSLPDRPRTPPMRPSTDPNAPLRISHVTAASGGAVPANSAKKQPQSSTHTGDSTMKKGTQDKVIAAITKANIPMDSKAVAIEAGLTSGQASNALTNAKIAKRVVKLGRLWGLPGMKAIADDAPPATAKKTKRISFIKRANGKKTGKKLKAAKILRALKPIRAVVGGANGVQFTVDPRALVTTTGNVLVLRGNVMIAELTRAEAAAVSAAVRGG
jgi:hypothetical protein